MNRCRLGGVHIEACGIRWTTLTRREKARRWMGVTAIAAFISLAAGVTMSGSDSIRASRAIAWGEVRNGSQNATGNDRTLRSDMFAHQSTSSLSSRMSGNRSSRVLTAMLASTRASGAPRQK